MLERKSLILRFINVFYRSVLLLVFVSLNAPFAQAASSSLNTPNAEQMLVNVSQQIPQLMQMVTAIGYVLGIYFILAGILKLKQFGEQRSMMSQEHSLRAPIVLLVVGTILLYIPTAVQVGTGTFWANSTPFAYSDSSDQWHSFVNDCFLIVEFIGTISFIRGLVILSHLGGHGGQPGQFAKGLTHIIGGIFAINIYQFVQVIMVTLGVTFS